MTDRQALSIVIPVYNGAATVGRLVDDLVVEGAPMFDLHIILVNDGSRDSSTAVMRRCHDQYPHAVTCIGLSRNFGEHNAVMAGLARTGGTPVVIMDDDFQNTPSDAFRLASHGIDQGQDIVFARYGRKHHHWFRNAGSTLTNVIAAVLLGLPRGLYLSSFKYLSPFAVAEILRYRGPFPYVDGLALRTTRNIGVIDVLHRPSELPSSGYTALKLFRLWMNMFLNFSVLPLRISSILGLVFSTIGALLAVTVVVERLLDPTLPVGWPSLAILTIMFSGVQLMMLGLLGEYLGHLFLSTNATPQYAVRDTIAARRDDHGQP